MSLASRRWGLADGQGQILPDGPRFVKSDWQRVITLCQSRIQPSAKNRELKACKGLSPLQTALHRQALHLAGGVLRAEQTALATEELHGLEQSGAHGAPGNGEA